METEIKLSPVSPEQAEAVFASAPMAPYLGERRSISMITEYYDDPKGVLRRERATLRLRRENGEGVCCLKLKAPKSGLASVREELEVRAESIREGAALLAHDPRVPGEISSALTGELRYTCGCAFTRTEADYERDGLSLVLSYDEGELRGGGRTAPIGELELELKRGSAEGLNALCEELMALYSLPLGRESKHKRALKLALEPAGGERP